MNQPIDNPNRPVRNFNHIILSCSNCNKDLIDIGCTRPFQDFTHKYRAKCGFCGDFSYIKEIKGGISIGGTPISSWSETVTDGDLTTFITVPDKNEVRVE